MSPRKDSAANARGAGPVWRALKAPIAPASWDRMLRSYSAASLAALAAVVMFPAVAAWVLFFTVVALVSGPPALLSPVSAEPLVLAFGRVYRPLLVALVATAAMACIELLNYRVSLAILRSRALRRVRDARGTRSLVRLFALSPFVAVFVAALSPLPLVAARALAALSDYPFGRYLSAVTLGKLPRCWILALGGSVVSLSAEVVLASALVAVAITTLALVRVRGPRPSAPAGPGLVGYPRAA